ncbi:MAG: hypothetical protein VW877_03400 [Pseudomonadaceae bacterium]
MSSNPRYQLPRGLFFISVEDACVDLKLDASRAIIEFDQSPSTAGRYGYVYRWCYLDRLAYDEATASTKSKRKVNLSSYCERRAAIVRKIISCFLYEKIRISVNHVSTAFNWIDKHGRGDDLHTLSSTKSLYQEYTKSLQHRIQLSNVGAKRKDAIGYGHASREQRGMAIICAEAASLKVEAVRAWAYQIPIRNRGFLANPAPKLTEEQHVVVNTMHARFFAAFCNAVVTNAPPPIVIELSDLGFDDVVFYKAGLNSVQGWRTGEGRSLSEAAAPLFFGRERVFQGGLQSFNELLVENKIEPIAVLNKLFVSRRRNAEVFTDADRQYMANTATRHFGYLLLNEAGSNASTLATVDISRARLEKTLGASRLLAVKGRAGYRPEDQFVDLRFAQGFWKDYLQLREWMVQRLLEDGSEAPSCGLFLLGRFKGKSPYNMLTAQNVGLLNVWPKGAPSPVTRDARKHKIVNGLEFTGGNTTLISGIQSVSVHTVERHYAFKNVAEAAKQMSEYFKVQAESAALRHSGVPIRILDEGAQTSTGRCDAVEEYGPQLIQGLESAGIQPRCEAPLTCLFCTHFGVHATEEDLLRLLTIKHWVEVQTRTFSSSIDESFEKYLPYIERIDHVFEESSQADEDYSQIFINVKALFNKGRRDPYWNAKINALLDLDSY